MAYSLVFLAINFILVIIPIVIIFYKQRFKYWQHRKIPYLQPNIPLGNSNLPLTGRKPLFLTIFEAYGHFKKQGAKHFGLYTFFKPIYVPIDLEYIRHILSKDFTHFMNRGIYYNEKHDPLSAHLVSLEGDKWKHLRAKLTPTFTSGKMKVMFQTLVDCGTQMIEAIEAMDHQNLDIKEVLGCYTTDVIGSCAFGIECNSFKNKNSDFRRIGKKALTTTPMKIVRRILVSLFKDLSLQLNIKTVDKEITNFFLDVVKTTIDYREKNNIQRNDFLQILIELKTQEDGLSLEQITAQCFVFFLAGFETSSTTMTFALYELSKNQDIQDRARKEIVDVLSKHDGELTYDSLKEMKFLDQIVNEILRLYSPAPMLGRICEKDYTIPNTDITIEKGMSILIPLQAIHLDPAYFEEPTTFKPDRFSDENKSKIQPYTYMPFGEGPRICIGLRFGLMQSKARLAQILKSYKFTLNENMGPLIFDNTSVLLSTKQPIKLDVQTL